METDLITAKMMNLELLQQNVNRKNQSVSQQQSRARSQNTQRIKALLFVL